MEKDIALGDNGENEERGARSKGSRVVQSKASRAEVLELESTGGTLIVLFKLFGPPMADGEAVLSGSISGVWWRVNTMLIPWVPWWEFRYECCESQANEPSGRTLYTDISSIVLGIGMPLTPTCRMWGRKWPGSWGPFDVTSRE